MGHLRCQNTRPAPGSGAQGSPSMSASCCLHAPDMPFSHFASPRPQALFLLFSPKCFCCHALIQHTDLVHKFSNTNLAIFPRFLAKHKPKGSAYNFWTKCRAWLLNTFFLRYIQSYSKASRQPKINHILRNLSQQIAVLSGT